MSAIDHLIHANERYAETFPGPRPLRPKLRLAVVACMDSRLDLFGALGLEIGDAHLIRNAGGLPTEEVLRSLAISQRRLGTREIVVIHHTECGMEYFTNDVMGDLLERSLETAELGPDGFRDIGTGPGSPAGREIDWLTISDREQSVVDDVARIRNHPLVEGTIPIHGFVYDVKCGRLVEIPAATRAGAPAV